MPVTPPLTPGRRVMRAMTLAFGWMMVVVGAIFALLPTHIGLLLLVPGLIIILRQSISARRRFIGLQRRHPKFVFPIRRLLRREPEVLPVLWQQILRIERFLFRSRRRPARRLRRTIFGRGRR